MFFNENNIEIGDDARALMKLKVACELAKRRLCQNATTKIIVRSLIRGVDFRTDLSRATLEELCHDMFGRATELVQKTLEDANLKKDEMDGVVLVGGW